MWSDPLPLVRLASIAAHSHFAPNLSRWISMYRMVRFGSCGHSNHPTFACIRPPYSFVLVPCGEWTAVICITSLFVFSLHLCHLSHPPLCARYMVLSSRQKHISFAYDLFMRSIQSKWKQITQNLRIQFDKRDSLSTWCMQNAWITMRLSLSTHGCLPIAQNSAHTHTHLSCSYPSL